MGTQVTCDRCKKVIEDNDEKGVYMEWPTPEGHKFVHAIDLCGNCFKELMEFIKFDEKV